MFVRMWGRFMSVCLVADTIHDALAFVYLPCSQRRVEMGSYMVSEYVCVTQNSCTCTHTNSSRLSVFKFHNTSLSLSLSLRLSLSHTHTHTHGTDFVNGDAIHVHRVPPRFQPALPHINCCWFFRLHGQAQLAGQDCPLSRLAVAFQFSWST